MEVRLKDLSVLIKPSSNRCNLNCSYCFYNDVTKNRDRNKGTMMNPETSEAIVKKAFDFADRHVTFAFQGGEPTLMGLDFFKSFIKYVHQHKSPGIEVDYTLQTNGILIDKTWADFFKKEGFLIGLSLDGLPEIHNRYRVNHQNEGSYKQVERTLGLLQRSGVDHNVLMVISKPLIKVIPETYKYLKRLGVNYLQIIPVLDPLYEGYDNYDYSLSKEDLESFLKILFDLWYKDFIDQKEVRITYFENIVYKMLGHPHVSCALNGRCAIQMVIEGDGSVYPCDFYVLDEWRMGNINHTSFERLLHQRVADLFVTESLSLNSECHKCQWFGLCQGSCKRYQLKGMDTYENYYCESYKDFFNYAHSRLESIAKTYQ